MRARDKRTATENKRQVLMFSRLGKNSKKTSERGGSHYFPLRTSQGFKYTYCSNT